MVLEEKGKKNDRKITSDMYILLRERGTGSNEADGKCAAS